MDVFTVELSRSVKVGLAGSLPASVQGAIKKLEILQRWDKALEKGQRPEVASRRLLGRLRREGEVVSRASLYLWRRAFRRHGFEGLLDGRGAKTGNEAMGCIARNLLDSYIDRLDGQGLAMVAMFAGMLASRRSRVVTRAKRADRAKAAIDKAAETVLGAAVGAWAIPGSASKGDSDE